MTRKRSVKHATVGVVSPEKRMCLPISVVGRLHIAGQPILQTSVSRQEGVNDQRNSVSKLLLVSPSEK